MNINSSENLISPGLIVIPERIIRNIKKMISIAGSPKRLWPHVKTHKLREIIDFQKEYVIIKFFTPRLKNNFIGKVICSISNPS